MHIYVWIYIYIYIIIYNFLCGISVLYKKMQGALIFLGWNKFSHDSKCKKKKLIKMIQ